jgi:pectate lyase
MKKTTIYLTMCIISLSLLVNEVAAQKLIAFPGAEGYGRFAQGGRGGDVYHVKNLDDSGIGSIRQGFETAKGPRTIVFDVSGNIRLKSQLRMKDKAFITIAGQTAPGDGITLCDQTFSLSNCHDIIIRYIRLRLGDQDKTKQGADVLTTDDVNNLIMDHVSLSWSIDGTHDLRRGGNFTLQWCLLGEALNNSIHEKGSHGMLGSYRDLVGNLTIHHNVFTTSRDRHPTLGAGGKVKENFGHIVDFRNNIIYNWGQKTPTGNQGGTTNFGDNLIVAINNIWRPGPETDPKIQPISIKGGEPREACGYMSGNIFEGHDDWTRDNYAALDFQRWRSNPGYKYNGTLADWKKQMPDQGDNTPAFQPAKEAFNLVLKKAGASLHRDAVDKRLVNDIMNRTGKLIDSQDQVGGWPQLKSLPALKDTDGDGMPDNWEIKKGLDPKNAADGNGDSDKNGFTNLEDYLNELAGAL